MIYDASTTALPREGRGVQHASFTHERVARDPIIFEPHITPGSYCLVFFVRGFGRSLDEDPDGLGVRSTVGSIEADGFECVAREQLAKDPGERARACEYLEQHEALSDRDDHTAGSLWWPDPVFCTRCYESVSTDSSSSGLPLASSTFLARSAVFANCAGVW